MPIKEKRYVPTLALRASEMTGLEFLPGATKDRMAPCFLLAPWATASTLKSAIGRIEKAYPKRNYFLDIDQYYQPSNPDNPAYQELLQLRLSHNFFGNWIDFVDAQQNVWPCVQTRSQTAAQIRGQIAAFQRQERIYCLRIVKDHFPENINEIVEAFTAVGYADFAVILEGGWTNDPLSLSGWFTGVIAGSLQPIDASVPIIISCTSMPKGFEAYNGAKPYSVPFSNRQLVEQIARNTNRARVVYGD
jgi:hypothetical protein